MSSARLPVMITHASSTWMSGFRSDRNTRNKRNCERAAKSSPFCSTIFAKEAMGESTRQSDRLP